MQGINAYISENGYLKIPEYNINYLVDPNESNIPDMPEATEASVKIAGRDGDIPLMTTYEPIPFNIVCYTDDNLSPNEKLEEESKVNRFLNSIKNSTTKLGFEDKEKFYNVKYSGALTTTRYPKHIKFSIPLKASDPYARYYLERKVTGNSTFESNTVKEVGATFIINGPAIHPKIAFNNYQMEYNYTVLEGNKLIINSNNSTITHETSLGVKTNAMRYYNHQFPKVRNGSNTLIIQSGINNDSQVSIEWYDLRL